MNDDMKLVLSALHDAPNVKARDRCVKLMADSLREMAAQKSRPRAELVPQMLMWVLRTRNKKKCQLAEDLGISRVVLGRWTLGRVTRLNEKSIKLLTPLWQEWLAAEAAYWSPPGAIQTGEDL